MLRSDALRRLARRPLTTRNVTVVAHVDHGKSTLSSCLLAGAGLLRSAVAGADVSKTDTMRQEQAKGITIKSTGVALAVDVAASRWSPRVAESLQRADISDERFLVNLIDSPGHVDFSAEVSAALRCTDGALLVVDAIDGVCVQTKTVLRQTIDERIVPALAINKCDRLWLEKQLDDSAAYATLRRTVANVNSELESATRALRGIDAGDDVVGAPVVSPLDGNVVFAAAKDGWAFTLDDVATNLSARHGVDRARLRRRLWGDHFYDSKTRKWSRSSTSSDGRRLERGFSRFVARPLRRVHELCAAPDAALTDELLHVVQRQLGVDDAALPKRAELDELRGKHLRRALLRAAFPAHTALYSVCVNHLPSPVDAQRARLPSLFAPPLDDDVAQAVARCDTDGPLVVYVSKMTPLAATTRKGQAATVSQLQAFGRVFSGTARVGAKVRAFTFDGVAPSNVAKIGQVRLAVGGVGAVDVGEVGAGCCVLLAGLSDVVSKSATLNDVALCTPPPNAADDAPPPARPLRQLKLAVAVVVRRALDVKPPSLRVDLLKAVRLLSATDPMAVVTTTKHGIELGAAGELHMDVCLELLRDELLPERAELVVGEPVVPLRETVRADGDGGECVWAKSAKKLNRLRGHAVALGNDVKERCAADRDAADDVDGSFSTTFSAQTSGGAERIARLLNENVGAARRVWHFDAVNVVCVRDATASTPYVNDVRDLACDGVRETLRAGPLCGEPVVGAAIVLDDAKLHGDAAHRNVAEITPTARRMACAALLGAQPALLEPVFRVDVRVPRTHAPAVYSVFGQRRGVVADTDDDGGEWVTLTAHVPVRESFGIAGDLRGQTRGEAFTTMQFYDWQLVDGDPTEVGSNANKLAVQVRERKKMSSTAVPKSTDYSDRL